jgi:hypothetical protein
MNTFARLAIAAAVVVVAVLGISQLPLGRGPTASGVAGASSAMKSTSSLSRSPEITPLVWGDLYSATDLSTGVFYGTSMMGLAFNVPSPGWIHLYGDEIKKGSSYAAVQSGEKTTATITFREESPDGVYADPCKHVRRDPVGRATETDSRADHLQHSVDLATALATIPGTNLIDGPSDVTVGGLPAHYVALSVREDIPCAGAFYLWYDSDRPSRAAPPGEAIRIWIVDYLRFHLRLWIEAETYAGTAPQLDQEIQQIVDSMEFGG